MRKFILSLALIPATIGSAEINFCSIKSKHIIDPIEYKCLATTIYGEARGESDIGMVAVAYTVVNRAIKKGICDVVLAPKQYSIFNNNPALRKAAMSLHIDPGQKNNVDINSWKKSLEIAEKVMLKNITDPTNGATHYLAPVLMKLKKYRYPKWSKEYRLMAVIDRHRFYKPNRKST